MAIDTEAKRLSILSTIVFGVKLFAEIDDQVRYADRLSLLELYSGLVTPDTYSVTYNANTADSGTVPTDTSSPYEENNIITVLGNTGSLTKTDYTFIGWNTSADGSGIRYVAYDTFSMSTSNVILYAQWAPAGSVIDDNSTGLVMAILMDHPVMRAIGNL